jgi:DNA-binding transcriptional MerR regulator
MADAASDALTTIRRMSDEFGVTARTLRFYESRGLLAPERRGQTRLYTRRDRARLKLILQGKRFGFSLEQLGELLALYDPASDNRAQTEAILAIARERLADMQSQQAALSEAIDELAIRIAEGEADLARR